MRIFKRIEVWLLLIMIGGAVWFVMQPNENTRDDPSETSGTSVTDTAETGTSEADQTDDTKSERFGIDDYKMIHQEGGGTVLEIDVINHEGNTIDLAEGNATLTDAEGEVFDRFFLPFDAPPVLEGVDSTAKLKFWIAGKLEEGKADFTLEIDHERLPLAIVLKK